MGDLWIGRFADFKGADTILLSCSERGLSKLSSALREAAAAPAAIHSLSEVSRRRPARLFAAASPVQNERTWIVDPRTLHAVVESLTALCRGGPGHQYFDLRGTPETLLVSFDEYDERWWRAHA